MHRMLGTLGKGTSSETTYSEDEYGMVYEHRLGLPERFICPKEMWPYTTTYASLEAQRQGIDIRTYWERQGKL